MARKTGRLKVGMGKLNENQEPMAHPKLKKGMIAFNNAGLAPRAKAAAAGIRLTKGGY